MAVAKASISGVGLRCRHCDHDQFFHRTGSIDRTVWGIFHQEGYWGHQTTIYVCAKCGCAHLFMDVPGAVHLFGTARDEFAPPPPPEPVPEEACLSCATIIPSDATACPNCGWTWQPKE